MYQARDPIYEAYRLSLLDLIGMAWHGYDSLHGVCFASLAEACELKAWLLQYNLTKFMCMGILIIDDSMYSAACPGFLGPSEQLVARIDWKFADLGRRDVFFCKQSSQTS